MGIQTDILIVGLGGIGGWCLELLAREPTVSRIVVAGVREGYGVQKLNTAISGAYEMGYYPEAEFVKMDLLEDVGKNAEILKKINPRLIINCATMLGGSGLSSLLLPPNVMKPLEEIAGLGPYLPLHLRLIYHLMLTVKASGLNPYVVNAAYPDATGPCLKTQGLNVDVGIGNLENMAVLVRKQVAQYEELKARDVTAYLVAHHFNNFWFKNESPGPRPPYFVKIFVDHRDVTEKYDTFSMLKNSAAGKMRLKSPLSDSQVASSICKNTLSLLNDSRILTNAPSPNGLPGGYPVRIGSDGLKLSLPQGITEEEAININIEGQRRDGIEEIQKDGTVVFPDGVVEAWTEIMNFRCKSFNVKDVDNIADEQRKRLEGLSKKYRK